MLAKLARESLRVLTSYGLACVVLVLLLVLTFLGTLEQTNHGIFDVQKKYFESIVLVHKIGGVVPLPLPGGALLMSLFALNLTLGGVVRVKKDRRRIGVLIGHAGILMLLVGSLVKFALAVEGNLMLFERETSAFFESYFDWEVTVREAPTAAESREWVIPLAVGDLEHRESLGFEAADLPFDVRISAMSRNCRPQPSAPFAPASRPGTPPDASFDIDGFTLVELPSAKESERNLAGLRIELRDKRDGTAQVGLLWGGQLAPLVVNAAGREWALDLHHRRFELPFGVRLDHFVHEEHPGTRIASDFTSHVTRLDHGVSQPVVITMNEPLRSQGYTLYQSSWGPQDAQPGDPVFSVFSVVRNPADRWPLYACIVIAIGLLVHFSSKLSRYLRSQQRSPA